MKKLELVQLLEKAGFKRDKNHSTKTTATFLNVSTKIQLFFLKDGHLLSSHIENLNKDGEIKDINVSDLKNNLIKILNKKSKQEKE